MNQCISLAMSEVTLKPFYQQDEQQLKNDCLLTLVNISSIWI